LVFLSVVTHQNIFILYIPGRDKNVADMVISRNAFERISLLWKVHLGKNNRKLTSKIIAKTIQEINFNSKLHNGNLEGLSNIFRDRLCRLYEIEPIMMLYVNPFCTLILIFVAKDISAIYEANAARPELQTLELQANLTLKITISGKVILLNYSC
jgi:hypothetical protein